MKNFISILLVFCLIGVSLAHGKIHEFSKKEVKTEVIKPANDLAFAEAVYLPLDVYATEGQEIDFTFVDTMKGFLAIESKPPLTEQSANRKRDKKWVWRYRRGNLIN